MKVQLDTLRRAGGKLNIWLIPVFEGTVRAAAKEFGFDARRAKTWGFDGQSGQSLNVTLDSANLNAILVGAGKPKALNTEIATELLHQVKYQMA